MEQLNKVFDYVIGFFEKLIRVFVVFLTLGVITQVLFGKPVMGMDVVGNVIAIIGQLGEAGFVGILAVVVLFAILAKK